MWAYIVRRLVWTPILLLVVSFITFLLGHYGPGDPIQILMGQYRDPEVVERIRHVRGLDRPFLAQYGTYVINALKGDFGESFKYRGRTVTELLAKRVWISAQLGIAATIITLALGIPLGFLAALKQGTWVDTAIISFTLLFMSLPVFLTAPALLLFFVVWTGLLPSSGWNGLFSPTIVMPALVLGVPGVAIIARLTRSSTLEVLSQDYVRTARSKGLTELVVRQRHVLRNALIPLFTVVGLSLASLVEGAFITEAIFGIPGVGRLAVEAVFSRDYPVIMAMTLMVATAFVAANLIVDLGYRFIDPRIRLF